MESTLALSRHKYAQVSESFRNYRKLCLSTDPVIRGNAAYNVRAAYRQAGYLVPRIYWCGSPFEAAVVYGLLSGYIYDRKATENIFQSPLKQAASDAEKVVSGSFKWELSSVGSRYISDWQVIEQVILTEVATAQRGDYEIKFDFRHPDSDVKFNLAKVLDKDRSVMLPCASHALTLAKLDCYERDLNIEISAEISGLRQMAITTGSFFIAGRYCVLSERPNKIEFDGMNRLHCESGPAISYPDGFGVYMWHGVRVPRLAVENPKKITRHMINVERNAEVRRVLLNRYGLDRWMRDGDVLDRQGDYVLLHKSDLHLGHMTFLKMVCPSTGTVYMSGVDPDRCVTVEQALNWKYQIPHGKRFSDLVKVQT